MLSQFDHTLFSSFHLWVDDRLSRVGQAIRTGESQIFDYYETDDKPSDMLSFYSQDRQFCANHSSAPSSVYVNGVAVQQSTSGTGAMVIDHDQGRILLSSGYGTGSFVSGNFIEREINIYTPNERVEEVLINREFLVESGVSYLASKGEMADHKYTLPAMFISFDRSKNDGFALGGLRETTNYIRAMVVSSSNYDCDAVSSLFRDSADKTFSLIPYSSYPFGAYWNVKNPPYSYTGLASQSNSGCAYIDEVSVYRMKDSAAQKIAKGVFVSIMDFEISTIREVV